MKLFEIRPSRPSVNERFPVSAGQASMHQPRIDGVRGGHNIHCRFNTTVILWGVIVQSSEVQQELEASCQEK